MRLLRGVLAPAVLATGVVVGPAAAPSVAADQCTEQKVQYSAETPYALKRLNAPYAWTVATGRGVVVAVVDSGVAAGNAHLRGALVPGTSLVPKLSATTDASGHGTAVAGEIAARPVKGSGVVGLAKDATIMPVRVFYDSNDESRAQGVGPRADRIAEGIRWAVDHGAKVVNVSLSTPTDDARLRAAVDHATARGALVVASAGNRTTAEDKSDGPRYPAAYPQVLAVAATDASDQVTDDSIHGAHVDVAAPGTDVLTTFHAAGDCLLSEAGESTSFATAYASAAAALLVQRFPAAGPAEWKHRLEVTASRTARDRRDDRAGWGLIQPYEALTASTDASLGGPPPPGQPTPAAPSVVARPIDLSQAPDVRAPERGAVLWWALAGASGVVALALGGLLRVGRRRPAR